MSLLKKLKGMLVEPVDGEDDEILVEDEPITYIPSTPIEEEKITPRVVSPRPRVQEVVEEKKEEKRVSSFVDISADDESAAANQRVKPHRTREVKRETKEQRESTREEEFGLRDDPYESSDVISPLYGRVSTEDEKGDKPTVRPMKSSKSSGVISPMYGRVEASEEEKKPVIEQRVEAEPIRDVFAAVDMEEEEDGIDLSSMLSKESEETLDETTQISLFGDHVAVTKQEQDMLELDEDESESYTQMIQKPEEEEK